MRNDYIPRSDAEFNGWQANFVASANANLVGLGLVAADLTPIITARGTARISPWQAPAKQNALSLLRQYVVDRWEMVDYPTALAHGWDIGSGPTEAMCKNLTLRLKRPGMKWDADNAASIMSLVALRESGQWQKYWEIH